MMQKKMYFTCVHMMAIWFVINFFLLPLGAQNPAKEDERKDIANGPGSFFLEFKDASLSYIPGTGEFIISAQDNLLSDGSTWEKAQVKPFLYHFRQKEWEGFYWKVNTGQKKAYKVTEGTFGRVGGTVHRLNVTVTVEGGSESIPPDRFRMDFSSARLVYSPASEAIQIAALGEIFSNGEDWEKCNFKTGAYHFRQKSWDDFYWSVNTADPIAYRVNDKSAFCQAGDFPMERLDVNIRVAEK